jgi:hypothetical protein
VTIHHLALSCSLLLGACSDYSLEPMPDIPPDAEPDIEVYPGALEFGAALAGEQAIQQLWIRNLGQATLSVDPLAFEGSGAFTLLEDPGAFTLQASEERALTVVFSPDEPSAIQASAWVMSNDPDSPRIEVPLSGEGLVPWLEITPANHDFGELPIPCEDQLELTLQNTGNTTLEITSLELLGDDQLWLSAAPPLPLTLVPGEVSFAAVAIQAREPGALVASLAASSNDPRGEVRATQQATITWVGEAEDRFEVPADPPVDVLFAVDRSSSMDDDAQRLGEAFEDFITALTGATSGWHIGVVTYDDACFNHGILDIGTPAVEQRFAEAVALGFDHEIVLDEQLLQLSDRALQQTGGGACNEGFLRSGALLHLIVVSDEPERSTETASAWSWDYWLERYEAYVSGPSLLKVSGVVDLDDCNEGAAGYLEAIAATGGEALSICDASWAEHAVALAEASSDFLFSFELSETPDPDSIVVEVDGGSIDSGWSYDDASNLVVFDEGLADSIAPGAEIVIRYGIASSCE